MPRLPLFSAETPQLALGRVGVAACILAVLTPTWAATSRAAASPTARQGAQEGAQEGAPPSAPADANGGVVEIGADPALRTPLVPEWLGAWIGEAAAPTIPGRPPIALPVTLVVSRAATDAPGAGPTVLMTVLPTGAVARPAIDTVGDGRAIGFTLDGGAARARFAAMVSEDGLRATGSCMLFNEQGESMPPALDLRLRRIDLVSELPEQRLYNATLDAAGQKLSMRLALGEGKFGPTGAFEIASQGLRDFPVEVARTEKGFVVKIPVGTTATLELATMAEGAVLEGTFTQGAFTSPIRFELEPGARLGGLRRPQDPVAPFPYEEREVRIGHPDGHALAATLTLPSASSLARDDRMPAVVLVSGSGPQDRDESLVGHRPFLVIADALARAGVAVLRYDDRGVARSTGDFTRATTVDFASDADEATRWLRTQPGIDPARIGIVGHSEGGTVAPIVAMWQNEGDGPKDPLAFLVLLAPPAEQGGKLLTRQTKALYDAAGVPAEKSGPAIEAHAAVMAAIVEGRQMGQLRPLVEEMVRRQVAIGSLVIPDDATLKPTFDAALAQVSSSWMLEFIRFDPRGVLSLIEIPSLALCGSKDIQVDMETNLGILDEIAKSAGAPIVTRRLDGLNHLLQPARSGLIEEYGAIDTTFDPKALAEMVAWIVETASKAPQPQIPDAKRPAGWTRPAAASLPAKPAPRTQGEQDAAMPTRRGIGGAGSPPPSEGTGGKP
jgi:pimeloyl-ACP methyl ester carboxylesterase